MDRGWYLRFGIVVVAIGLAWCTLWPSIDRWVPAPKIVKEYFPGRISPGLDIKGGLRLMYEVDIDEAIRNRRDRLAEGLLERLGAELDIIDLEDVPTREELEKVRKRIDIEAVDDYEVRVKFDKAEDAKVLTRDFLEDRFPSLKFVSQQETTARVAIREKAREELQDKAVQQTERTIKNRIDELQIRETTVIGRQTDIIVEVPGAGEKMFDRIRSIISRTARLEFLIADDKGASEFVGGLPELPEGIQAQTETAPAGENKGNVQAKYLVARGEDARHKLQKFMEKVEVPDGHQLAVGKVQKGPNTDEEAWRTYYLFSDTDVTGEDIKDAFVAFDQQQGGQPYVAVNFDSSGASRFERMTGRNVGRRMAIVLDGRVESAPVIQTKIGGGRAKITLGNQGYNELVDEANELVIVLRAGALPAPIHPANEQLIGPTLGQDSVEKGALGALVGVLLVMLFMAVYYQVGGMVADTMVVLNLLFLMAIMAGFEATLTLPGVAAIALTVGMAVDANVLITERIREELRLGKSPRSAVDQGFKRAFWSIFDSQVTTFIAGVVLFQYGTGPIKGFAVMLMIGIVTSLFTGIFCSKVFLDWIVRGLRVARLRVG
jgi:preprotein translocase subunit SecD